MVPRKRKDVVVGVGNDAIRLLSRVGMGFRREREGVLELNRIVTSTAVLLKTSIRIH